MDITICIKGKKFDKDSSDAIGEYCKRMSAFCKVHVKFFKNIHGMVTHMKKHAEILRPKFEAVLNCLDRELTGLEIGTWIRPRGGYFISFDSMEGCAKAIVAKAKEAGLIMTPAGATFPYGKDPKDSNIRIAPSFPTPEELELATKVFVLSVKLVSVEKLLETFN